MIIYWFLFFSAAAFSLLYFVENINTLRFCSAFCLFVLILCVASFKYASIDYFEYQSLYYTTYLNEFSFPFFEGGMGTTGKEFVWATVSSFFYHSGFSFPVWVFFIALVSITIKFYFFKKYSKYFLLTIAIYITQSFIKDMGQLRNGLAGAILLFSVAPILKRDVIKFVLVVVMAFGVQAYAIIALPLYWLYPLFLRMKYSLIFILLALSVLSFSGGVAELIMSKIGLSGLVHDRMLHKLEGYSEVEVDKLSITSFTGATYTLIMIVLLYYKGKIHATFPLLSIFSLFHFYGVSLFLLFTGMQTINVRSLDLFSMTALPFLLVTPMLFSKGVSKFVFFILIIVFCTLRFYANMGALSPYNTIFGIL